MRHAGLLAALPLTFLLALHVAMAQPLIDPFPFLDPDHAEFLIGARSLYVGQGYRDLSDPRMPPLTRPPGMSLLLAPITAVRGYDVLWCKEFILLFGLMNLGLMARLFRPAVGGWRLGLLLASIGTGPIFLVHDARMMSEVPFTTLTLALFLLLREAPAAEPFGWARLLAATLLALAAEKIRSQGLAVWPALLAWALLRDDRRRLFPAILAFWIGSALVGKLLFPSDTPTGAYWTYLRQQWQAQGSAAVVHHVLGAIELYLPATASVLDPLLWPGLRIDRTGYLERLPLLWPIALGLFVWVVVAIRLLRSNRENRAANGFLAIYLLGSLAILVLWPHRMGRLFYPLLFLAMIPFWQGLLSGSGRPFWSALLLVHFAVQLGGGLWLLWANPKDTKGVERELAAARWLAEKARENSVVLTFSKALFLHAHRFQDYVAENTLTVAELNDRLLAHGTRFAQFGPWENQPQVTRNPGFLFHWVEETSEANARLWRVEPNETGIVPGGTSERMQERLREADAALKNIEEIARADLVLKHSHTLRVADRLADAERLLQGYLQSRNAGSTELTDLHMELGHVLLERGDPTGALRWYRRAAEGTNTDYYQRVLVDCQAVCEDLIRAKNPLTSAEDRASLLEGIAQGYASTARWRSALRLLDESIAAGPTRSSSRLLRVSLLRLLGQEAEARVALEAIFALLRQVLPNEAARWQHPAHLSAVEQRLMLDAPPILASGKGQDLTIDGAQVRIEPSEPDTYRNVASLFARDKLAGMTLKLLRLGAERHPENTDCRREYGQMLAAFGRFEEALVELEAARKLRPGAEIGAEIRRVETLLQRRPID